MTAEELSSVIIKGMEEKKASNIVLMDLRNINQSMTDFFVICSGSSNTQVDAISQSIEEEVIKVHKERPWRSEGKSNGQWVLMDYVNVVVHIFLEDTRGFYRLEDLWGDAKVTAIN